VKFALLLVAYIVSFLLSLYFLCHRAASTLATVIGICGVCWIQHSKLSGVFLSVSN